LKAEKTFCSGSLRLVAWRGKSKVMGGGLRCDVEALLLLVLELDGTTGALAMDCKLAWD
jgi:hypothetical protein